MNISGIENEILYCMIFLHFNFSAYIPLWSCSLSNLRMFANTGAQNGVLPDTHQSISCNSSSLSKLSHYFSALIGCNADITNM